MESDSSDQDNTSDSIVEPTLKKQKL